MAKEKKVLDIPGDKKSIEIKVDKYKADLRKMRFDNKLGQLSNTSAIKKHRRDVAKMLTRLSTMEKK